MLLSNLILAIRDHKTSDAIAIISRLSTRSLKKKKKYEANRAFLLAMANRLEDVALAMYERGIPGDINSPILSRKNSEHVNIPCIKLPSYFILALSLGLFGLVRAMLKVFLIFA